MAAEQFSFNTGITVEQIDDDTDKCDQLKQKIRTIVTSDELVVGSGSVNTCWPIDWVDAGNIKCTPAKGGQGACNAQLARFCGGNLVRNIVNAKGWTPQQKLQQLGYYYNAANVAGGNCKASGKGASDAAELAKLKAQVTVTATAKCLDLENGDSNGTGKGDATTENGVSVGNAPGSMKIVCVGNRTLGDPNANPQVPSVDVMVPATVTYVNGRAQVNCGQGFAPLKAFGNYVIVSNNPDVPVCCRNPESLPDSHKCSAVRGLFALSNPGQHDDPGGPTACSNGKSYQYLTPLDPPNDTCAIETYKAMELCGQQGYMPAKCANPFANAPDYAETIKSKCEAECMNQISTALAEAKRQARADLNCNGDCAALLFTDITVSCDCYPESKGGPLPGDPDWDPGDTNPGWPATQPKPEPPIVF